MMFNNLQVKEKMSKRPFGNQKQTACGTYPGDK